MSAAFMGGLGNFATGFMKGYEQSEDREYLKKARDFEEGQRQRKLDEQKRADQIREADAAVSITEQAQLPETKTIYGKDAPVVRDDDGNLMPGAVDEPAKSVTRQRTWDSIYRDYAANRQKAGDTAGALDFTDKANKLQAQRSANAFVQVQADAGSKSAMQVAQEIGKIFDSDPMNGGTKSIQELPGGGVRMTLFNKDTGQTSTREFTGPNAKQDLIAAFNPYFRPESYSKLLDKRMEVAAEIEKDPYKTVPGGYIDKRTGKFSATMVGQDIIGTNEDGSPIYGSKGPGGSSRGTGGTGGTGGNTKAPDPLKAATEAVEFAIDKSSAKGALEPSVVARANTIGRQLVASAAAEGRGLDPSVAAELAINAATGKTPVVPAFNPRTGTIDNVVEYQGNNFAVEGLGTPTSSRLDPKQLSSVAINYIGQIPPEQRSKVVAAAYNPQALASLNAEIEQRARSADAVTALGQRLGRQPTETDIRKAVSDAQNAVRPSIELIGRYATLTKEGEKLTISIAKQAGYTSDFKGMAPKQTGGMNTPAPAPDAGLGMRPRPTTQERRAMVDQARQRQQEADAELTRNAPIEARRLLARGDIKALMDFQSSPAFGKLDRETKMEIYKRVNGIQ